LLYYSGFQGVLGPGARRRLPLNAAPLGGVTMRHEDKVRHFLAEMQQRGFSQWNAAPPAVRVLWRVGIHIPPPYFVGFFQLTLGYGVPFGIACVAVDCVGPWRDHSHSLLSAARYALIMGAPFGLFMAWITRHAARGLSLPSWGDYPSPAGLTREAPAQQGVEQDAE